MEAPPAGFAAVTEGATRLLVPAAHTTFGPAARARPTSAFYNAAAALSRDISVLYMAARHRGSDARCVDVFAGTGARGVRWLVEAGLRRVTLNDRSPRAVEAIRRNLAANGVEAEVTERDALGLLAEAGFQHVELDPYGTPAPYLDMGLRALGRRGGLSVTATDAAALCGNTPRPCVRRYQATPTRTPDLTHEAALRILAGSVVRIAARRDVAAVPVLCNSREHYFRCYFETTRSAQRADATLARIAWLVECDACLHRGFEPQPPYACPACGGKPKASGPLWGGPLWDRDLLAAMSKEAGARALARSEDAARDVALWAGEAEAGGLPFEVHRLAREVGIKEPPPIEVFVNRLRSSGVPAARSHQGGTYVRTPAPAQDLRAAVRG